LARSSLPPKIFADDTPVPVLGSRAWTTKTGRLWAYARDDRPWQGPAPPVVAYVYSENRQGAHPRKPPGRIRQVLQVDDYSGFDQLVGDRSKGAVKIGVLGVALRSRLQITMRKVDSRRSLNERPSDQTIDLAA
jgi:transposase